MKTLPVKVTEEGVLIPKEYLQQADEFEVVVQNGDILVRPKNQSRRENANNQSWLHDLIGIAESDDPTASERAEEILEAEIDRRSGWTLKPPISQELLPSESSRFSFVGIARSKNPNASAEVEEILQKELGVKTNLAEEE